MIIQDLFDEANTLADESFEDDIMVQFYNQCTADINIRANAVFPSINENNVADAPVLPEKWARSLYVPFMAASIKQQDSSQFEYADLFARYEQAFGMFLAYYTIPDQYIDKSNWVTDPETDELVEPEGSSIFTKPSYPPYITRW